MRVRATVVGLAAALAATALGAPSTQDPAAATPSWEQDVLPLLDRYCAWCHEGPEAEAGLDLLRFADEAEALSVPEVWQRVRLQVGSGLMPPEEREEQPGLHERATLLAWIRDAVDPRTAIGPAVPHAPVLRRLTRLEYRNTVREVLGVDFPAEDFFPAEGAALGFDHLGSALTTSEALVEKYFDAAERIAGLAVNVEDPEHPPRRRIGAEEWSGGRMVRGSAALFANGVLEARLLLPRPGRYRIRAQAWGQQTGSEPCRTELRLGGVVAGRGEVPGSEDAPTRLEFELGCASAGETRVAAAFLNDDYRPDHPDPAQRDRNFYLDWIEVEGPLDPPPLPAFQREILSRFGEELGPRRERAMLAWMARRLWRRPVGAEELQRLEALHDAGTPLAIALRDALAALLSSPNFLFRLELDPPRDAEEAEVRDLDAYELASRLSYFLWSSPPDEALDARADDGSLTRPEVLVREAERLLDDSRAHALASSFAAQWLQLRALERVAPDPARHPSFTPTLRAAMREETLRLFEYVLREDRDLRELLSADYSFVNAELAAHYGLEGVVGEELRLVSLADTPRRGLLGHASVLTVTSTPTRTAPVKRGKFILDNVLGQPLPPPPPGVDSLLDETGDAAALSPRERLALHRTDPACGACHAVLDPLGFALENFDAVGSWREDAEGFPVEARGSLPDGRDFAGPRELVAALGQDDAFVRCVAEKLLVYALARAPAPGDAAGLAAILAETDPRRPTLRAVILAIIRSPLFRQRTLPNR